MVDQNAIGIRNVFDIQRSRLLPMPTYKLSEPNRVAVAFYGGVLNEAYSRLLAAEPLLELNAVLLPDMVQKEQPISKEQAHMADELSRRKRGPAGPCNDRLASSSPLRRAASLATTPQPRSQWRRLAPLWRAGPRPTATIRQRPCPPRPAARLCDCSRWLV